MRARKVLFSYSRKDLHVVLEIRSKLLEFDIPVWMDLEGIEPTQD